MNWGYSRSPFSKLSSLEELILPRIPGINLKIESVTTNAATSPPDNIKSPMLISSISLLSSILSSTPSKCPQIKLIVFSLENSLASLELKTFPLGLK